VKGIELCERFYLEYGAPMLKKSFGELEGLIAVGVAGSGSECLGYDDEISRDHDFEAGFCIFLPDESLVDRKTEFALERAYSKLPDEFMGYKRQKLSPVGGNRHGVMRISDFMLDKTGKPDGVLSLEDWFFVPEQALLEATDGKIFCDGLGLISSIRSKLYYMPEDVRRKKLAGELLMLGQTGQYNYSRCVARGDSAAAQLVLAEFVKSAIHVCCLVDRKYMPYYKWSFRALGASERFSSLCEELEYLISSFNTEEESKKKLDIIENVCQTIVRVLLEQKLSADTSRELEAHAYSVNATIRDPQIRNQHIFYGV
jgi:hypothetical protein